jgi:hypothetical protein
MNEKITTYYHRVSEKNQENISELLFFESWLSFRKQRRAKTRGQQAVRNTGVHFHGDSEYRGRPSLTSFTGSTTGHCGCMEVRHKPWENIEPPQVMEPETRKAISPLTYYYYPLTHYPFRSLSISCSSNVSSVRESLHPSRTPSHTHIVIQSGHHKSYNNDKVDFPMHDTCHIKLYCLLVVYLSRYRVYHKVVYTYGY